MKLFKAIDDQTESCCFIVASDSNEAMYLAIEALKPKNNESIIVFFLFMI